MLLATTNVFLNGEREDIRTQETNLGNLVTEAHLAFVQSVDPNINVALVNSGTIQDSLDVGEITELDIETILPFNNDLMLLTVTGREFEQIIEHSVASYGNIANGRFPQISGFSFSYDPTQQAIAFNEDGTVATEGERVKSLVITDSEGNEIPLVENGELVAENADTEIRLVTIKYLVDGGDDYPFPQFADDVTNLHDTSIKDFFIGFDPNRISETTSGLYLQDYNLGTGKLGPKGTDIKQDFNSELNEQENSWSFQGDLLFSPELAAILNLPQIVGVDFADISIEADIEAVEGGNYQVIGGETTMILDMSLLELAGFTLESAETTGTVDLENGLVSFPIVGEEDEDKFTFNADLSTITGTIDHIGEIIFDPPGDAHFADAGTEQDSVHEYLIEVYGEDTPYDIPDTPMEEDQRIQQIDPGISLVIARDALGANDNLDWSSLGSLDDLLGPFPVNILPNTFAGISEGGLTVDVQIPEPETDITSPLVFHTTSDSIATNFAEGDYVLFTGLQPDVPPPTPGNSGPIVINFEEPIFGVGTQIAVDDIVEFIVSISAFDDQGNLLGTFSNDGTSSTELDNSATFLGVLSDEANISRIEYSSSEPEQAIGINNLSILVADEPVVSSSPVFGTVGADMFDAALNFEGDRHLVFTGSGDDLVDASPGVGYNRLYGGSNSDELYAGASDRLFGGSANDILDSTVGKGDNRLYGNDGDDELYVKKGDRAFGGLGNDTLDATLSEGDNRLYGGEDHDIFFLGTGDRLLGGNGDDAFFIGEGGANTITGGEGADQFWVVNAQIPDALNPEAGLPDSANTITDLELDMDTIGIGGFSEADLVFSSNEQGDAVLLIDSQAVAIFLGITETQLEQADFIFM